MRFKSKLSIALMFCILVLVFFTDTVAAQSPIRPDVTIGISIAVVIAAISLIFAFIFSGGIKYVTPENVLDTEIRKNLYEYIDECSQEITRLLLNYLSSFITFYSHLYTKYKRLKQKGYDFFKDYERITSACYDGSFPYRFFYKFRNYAQHCGLPPIEMLIHEQLTQDGNVDIYVSISLLRDSLLRSYEEWGEKVKADLQNQPEHIELIPYPLDIFFSSQLGIAISVYRIWGVKGSIGPLLCPVKDIVCADVA